MPGPKCRRSGARVCLITRRRASSADCPAVDHLERQLTRIQSELYSKAKYITRQSVFQLNPAP